MVGWKVGESFLKKWGRFESWRFLNITWGDKPKIWGVNLLGRRWLKLGINKLWHLKLLSINRVIYFIQCWLDMDSFYYNEFVVEDLFVYEFSKINMMNCFYGEGVLVPKQSGFTSKWEESFFLRWTWTQTGTRLGRVAQWDRALHLESEGSWFEPCWCAQSGFGTNLVT